jgi:DNA-binding LytR/AlgR family response regulator
MTSILLVEDEPPALAALAAGVRAWDPDVEIAAELGSVRDTVEWLRTHRHPDLAIFDVHLRDGSSLAVFSQVPTAFPVVFATAYDRYALEAFAHGAIDYLLKPLRQEQLASALDKYLRLRAHFRADLAALPAALAQARAATAPRERLLVQKGLDFVSLPVGDVAYLFTAHGVVFARTRGGDQYLVDEPLAEVAARLDPRRFFRVNRQLLASLDAVRRFRRHDKGRLLVTLEPATKEDVVVSQERAAAFREWLAGG